MAQARKRRIFDIIQIGYDEDWQSRLFDVGLIVMIAANLFIVVCSTFEEAKAYLGILDIIELVTVVAFAIEYALRVWTAEYLYPNMSKGKAAVRYIFSFNGLVDMFSFLPHFLPIFFPSGLVAFRMFRVVRIFRLFRVNAYYDAMNVIGEVINRKKDQILSSVFIILVLMMASSLCMYSLEHEAQPEVFQNAFSGFWWAVSALLTVGYGDIYPITIPGRIFGVAITFLGVGMVAIPTGILSAGFVEQYARLKNMKEDLAKTNIHFIRLEVQENHPWLGRKIRELALPPGLLMAVILRKGRVLVPRGETAVRQGDFLILCAEGCSEDQSFILKEITLQEGHPWVDKQIKELRLSRQTLIVMVRRCGRLLIPDGSLTLQAEDMLVLHTKKVYRDMQTVEI